MFFLFFREKKRKNQRKETLSGGFARSPADGPHPALCAAGSGRAFFLFFREKKEPKKRNLIGVRFARSPAGGSARIAKKPVGERGGCSFPRFARAVFPCPAFAQGGKGGRCEEMFMRRESL